MIEILLAIPLITAALCYVLKNRRAIEAVSTAGSLLVFVVGGIHRLRGVHRRATMSRGSGTWTASAPTCSSSSRSSGSWPPSTPSATSGREYEEKTIDLGKVRYYYLLFHVFIFTMLLVCVSNNLGHRLDRHRGDHAGFGVPGGLLR